VEMSPGVTKKLLRRLHQHERAVNLPPIRTHKTQTSIQPTAGLHYFQGG